MATAAAIRVHRTPPTDRRNQGAARVIRKRSISLKGHPTSVSLEDEYWAELKRMAAASGLSLAGQVETIDARREGLNLSSALRVAVLADLKRQLAEKG